MRPLYALAVLSAFTVAADARAVLRRSSHEVQADGAGSFRLEYRLEQDPDRDALHKVLAFTRADGKSAFTSNLGLNLKNKRFANFSWCPKDGPPRCNGVLTRKPPLAEDEAALVERLSSSREIAERYFKDTAPGEHARFFQGVLETIRRSPVAEIRIAER